MSAAGDATEAALRTAVFENLAAATENGHDFEGMSADEIAEDMIAHAADVGDHTVDELRPHVEEWLRQRRAENE